MKKINKILRPKSKKEIEKIYKDLEDKGTVIIFTELLGKKIEFITLGDSQIHFLFNDDKEYLMYHQEDCCEEVLIEDINGNIDDLIDSPLIMAEKVVTENENAVESGTWTFFKFATIKGYVTIRWYGSSNGYYSEDIDFFNLC